MATASIFLASCGSKADSGQAAVADEALTVDNVLDNAENMLATQLLWKGSARICASMADARHFL